MKTHGHRFVADLFLGNDREQGAAQYQRAGIIAAGDEEEVDSFMAYVKKIVLHCRSDYWPTLDVLIEQFKSDGVVFVGVVGPDCERIESIIDELCVGDGTKSYKMLTSSHPNESVEAAVRFAKSLTSEFEGDVQVVDF